MCRSVVFTGWWATASATYGYSLRHIRLQPPLHTDIASATYGYSLRYIYGYSLRYIYGYSLRYIYGYSLHYIWLQPPLHTVTASASYGHSRYVQIQPPLHTVTAPATVHTVTASATYCYSLLSIWLQPSLHTVTAATYRYSPRYIRLQPPLQTVAASTTYDRAPTDPYCYCFTYGYFAAILYKKTCKMTDFVKRNTFLHDYCLVSHNPNTLPHPPTQHNCRFSVGGSLLE